MLSNFNELKISAQLEWKPVVIIEVFYFPQPGVSSPGVKEFIDGNTVFRSLNLKPTLRLLDIILGRKSVPRFIIELTQLDKHSQV